MQSNKIIPYLCLLLVVCSCATLKPKEDVAQKVELTEENLHLINGTYQINENRIPNSLDYFFGSYYRTKEWKSVYKMALENPVYYITLDVLNKKRINAILSVNDSVIKTHTIKGKIKKGFFEQNRKGYIMPALLLNEFHSYKFRIGLLSDHRITTDTRKVSFGTVYFFSPFNNSESYYNIIHKKI